MDLVPSQPTDPSYPTGPSPAETIADASTPSNATSGNPVSTRMQIDAIKIRTSVPQGFVVAGRPFSLTTTVTNPHDEPIDIESYRYLIPYQVQWINDQTFDREFEQRRVTGVFSRLGSGSIWRTAASPPGQVMSYSKQPGAPDGMTLQVVRPAESQSYSFRALIPQWLFISGGQITFQGTVAYRRGAEAHTSTFEVSFPYRPPLRSITVGAVIGAVLGTVARILKDDGSSALMAKPGEALTATVLAIILSIIGVVYSSRRSNDVQPVLTVEDVWGGMILGFLIGYLGHEFFQKIVPVN